MTSSPQFHQKNWSQRFQAMGDEAEAIFEEVYGANWVRTGLNRPPLQVHKLSVPVRYMPDYLTTKSWVEVQGCGSQRVLRIKEEKLESLWTWETLGHPVYFFIWDRTASAYTFVKLEDMYNIIAANSTVKRGVYPEGKKFYEIPVVLMDGWTPYVSAETEQ